MNQCGSLCTPVSPLSILPGPTSQPLPLSELPLSLFTPLSLPPSPPSLPLNFMSLCHTNLFSAALFVTSEAVDSAGVSHAELAPKCSVVFSMMANDAALQSVFDDYLSGRPQLGSIYVDCSTVC
jgi:hypothetical protein